ncbi:hypothetical protein B566_EDAN004638 [Ephemera danica]|nr:hypothetical protein B566_EDAN004638 [Ephemera danica]
MTEIITMDNHIVTSKLKRKCKYRAKCDFQPQKEDIVSLNNGTLSNPSTPKVNRKNNSAIAAVVGQLEKCNSEPSVAEINKPKSINSNKSNKSTTSSKSENHLPSSVPQLDVFLTFSIGDEFQLLARSSKVWWAMRSVSGAREIQTDADVANDNESSITLQPF